MNGAADETVRAGLRALSGQLDEIDEWILDGVLGGAKDPNAADLQIATACRSAPFRCAARSRRGSSVTAPGAVTSARC